MEAVPFSYVLLALCTALAFVSGQIKPEWTPDFNRSDWRMVIEPYSGTSAVKAPDQASVDTLVPSGLRFSADTSSYMTSTTWPPHLPHPTCVPAMRPSSTPTINLSTKTAAKAVNSDEVMSSSVIQRQSELSNTNIIVYTPGSAIPNITETSLNAMMNDESFIVASATSVAESSSTAQPLTSASTSISIFNATHTSANTLIHAAIPQYRGFNVINQSPTRPGQWKNSSEWQTAFHHILALPGNFNAVRLYSTTDGNARHLAAALPTARNLNISVHAGVWSGGDLHTDRFALEKAALEDVLATLGCSNIVAVSVGNEDMYNNHRTDGGYQPLKDVMLLVNQTQEIMDVLDKYGCCNVEVTHADTFGDWLQTNISEPLIRQVDFLTVNLFPYWESTSIVNAAETFWRQLNQTKLMAASYGKDIWIGETGWPVRGPLEGEAVPGVENLQKYWSAVGCPLLGNMNAFWYTEWDDGGGPAAQPFFGIMDTSGKSVIGNVSCT